MKQFSRDPGMAAQTLNTLTHGSRRGGEDTERLLYTRTQRGELNATNRVIAASKRTMRFQKVDKVTPPFFDNLTLTLETREHSSLTVSICASGVGVGGGGVSRLDWRNEAARRRVKGNSIQMHQQTQKQDLKNPRTTTNWLLRTTEMQMRLCFDKTIRTCFFFSLSFGRAQRSVRTY